MTKPKVHVRKGDTVLIIAGKAAGKKGKVLAVQPLKSRVIVEGINKVKWHSKASRSNPQGGIVEQEAPVHSSNVMLVCSKCHKPTRVGKQILDNGNKVRQCKRCGEVLS